MTLAFSYCDYGDSFSPSCGSHGWGFPGESGLQRALVAVSSV